jgi:16S rRNA (adenine(1408)-N(1))-methyltransferase
VRHVVGRKIAELDVEELHARLAGHERVVVDVGTGAGAALLRRARHEPGAFFIGLDADADSMRDASARAVRQPTRGGVANIAFVAAGADELPGALAAVADEVTVVLPWGSLLRAVLAADSAVGGLVALLRPGGKLELLLSVAQSDVAVGAPPFDADQAAALAAEYERLGLARLEVRLADEADVERLGSSWGRRLGIPRRRQAWLLSFGA